MSKISALENAEIAKGLMDLSITRLERVFALIYEKDEEYVTSVVRSLAKRITKPVGNALRQVGHKYEWRYADCRQNFQGWVDVTKFRPFPFDMTVSKVDRVGEAAMQHVPCWWTGESWEGRKLKKEDKVKYWKLEPWGN